MEKSERGIFFLKSSAKEIRRLGDVAELNECKLIFSLVDDPIARSITLDVAFDPNPSPNGVIDRVFGVEFIWYACDETLDSISLFAISFEWNSGARFITI